MQKTNIPFALEVSGTDAPFVKSGILQNMYAVGKENDLTLRQRYGMKLLQTFDTEIAGVLLRDGKIYVLAENKINVLTTEGNPLAEYPYIHSPNDRFIFLYNNVEAAGLSNTGAYFVLSNEGAVTQPSFPEGWSSAHFTYINGYFVFVNNAAGLEQQFFFSGLLDGSSFNGLDFSSAIEKYDKITAGYGAQNGLWVFGQNSIEVFQNSTDPDDPFQQISGANTTSIGCVSPYSVTEVANSLFFVGFDNNVYRTQGYSPEPIGNAYVCEVIARYVDKGAIYGFAWRERGVTFYVLTLPGRRTFAYCVNTGLWSEFKTFGQEDLAVSFCDAYGADMFCSVGNQLFKVTPQENTDGALPLEREFSSIDFETEAAQNFITHYVELNCVTGQKPLSQEYPAALDFSYSEDSGVTWRGDRFLSLGETGDYSKVTSARRLGSARRRIYRFSCTQPFEFSVKNIYAGIEVSDND